MRGLGVADARLDAFDGVFDVAVGDVDVGPAVEIVVEEEAAEAQREKGGAAYFRVRGFVDEEAVAFVVIEGEHLIRKIRDDEAGVA